MRMRVAAALGLVAGCSFVGCSFDRAGLATDGVRDAASPDATVDAHVDARVDAMVDADPCPSGYAPVAGGPAHSQYRFVNSTTDWLTAEQACEHDGLAHLAILDDDSERAAVLPGVAGQAWLGVTDRVSEGTFFKVTTGLATYLPWLSGEPNNQGNEDCVELKDGGFNDEKCDAGDVYVCECDGRAANPVAYTAP